MLFFLGGVKYAVLHSKADFGWNAAGTILSFCKVRKISKLGLLVSAKALTRIWRLSQIGFAIPD
ncbi:hypothetical protein EGT49_00030 [Companilactobacillus suantsaicola]|uniref:Uncharacterized protein n=1 Tax=Companilactobacillus suantsaicola TaxID=2487723 RepID=A0A4Z0JQG9_9LACO|nr:hypothetical protein EGT49_00030 [Companilactobacillus suantsaicola]